MSRIRDHLLLICRSYWYWSPLIILEAYFATDRIGGFYTLYRFHRSSLLTTLVFIFLVEGVSYVSLGFGSQEDSLILDVFDGKIRYLMT